MLRPHCEDLPNKGLIKYQLSALILLQLPLPTEGKPGKNQICTFILLCLLTSLGYIHELKGIPVM